MTNLNQDNQDNNKLQESQIEAPIESAIEEPIQIDLFADILGENIPAAQPANIPSSDGKKKVPSSISKATTTAQPKKAEPKPKEVYGTEWTIAYSGITIGLPKEMTEDEIHSFVERDYPELSKRRARANFDKQDKVITFSVTGAKKG